MKMSTNKDKLKNKSNVEDLIKSDDDLKHEDNPKIKVTLLRKHLSAWAYKNQVIIQKCFP